MPRLTARVAVSTTMPQPAPALEIISGLNRAILREHPFDYMTPPDLSGLISI
ncbi:MAG TPA: hypothetical protein VKB47_13205 [Terracidiphilus sp.]|nr:hypothetical protein [Terracidiphilus sp.]